MKALNWAIAVSLLAVVPSGIAAADEDLTPSLRQPALLSPTAFEENYYSQDDVGEAVVEPIEEIGEACCGDVGCCGSCQTCGGDSCGQCSCRSCCRSRITLGGWLDQGITWNPDEPGNRFNGPVTFNDRSNEYQLNQLYLYAERETCTGGRGWDVGGRIDLLYGTDYRFTVSHGLEDEWNQTERFYGLSVPQAYLDLAYKNLTLRVGHFYTIVGYEQVTAPDNFFYSHAYTMQYGEPFTHTGALCIYDVGGRLALKIGVDRGWNNWEDNNDELSFLGGISYTSCDRRATLGLGLTSGNEDDAGQNNRTLFSFVFTYLLTDRLQYVFQHDCGWEEAATGQRQDAEWYGVINSLFYAVNPCWTVGIRHEWFADDDGVRVFHGNGAGGPPKGMRYNAVPCQYQDIALGVNWTPRSNLLLRTELRWDWTDPLVALPDAHFDDYTKRDQFLLGVDLIVSR